VIVVLSYSKKHATSSSAESREITLQEVELLPDYQIDLDDARKALLLLQ
jgi:hypothetical protein